MQQKILTPTQEMLLSIERHWLTNLQIALARFHASVEDRAALEQSVRQLDELFLLVIVGEFNAGKSAFINALFGEQLLEEGVTPTTSRIQLLKYGREFERVAIETFTHKTPEGQEVAAQVDVYTAPAPLLNEINIVDTPGTNAIYRDHEALTRDFVPRSDLILFITSVDRPFTESERAFLQKLREWGKKVLIILNKIDLLDTPETVEEIRTFIAENARDLLGFTPDIFPVSARQALQGRRNHDAALVEASRILELEAHILSALDEEERLRLKLLNPIGVATYLIDKYVGLIDGRLDLLREDFAVMADVERQLAVYREDMRREFSFRLSDVEKVLVEFENRGMAYFDETMHLLRVIDLLNKSKLEQQFQAVVISDSPALIETRVHEMVDWLIESNYQQWQAVMNHVIRRREKHAERIVGEVGGAFDKDRARLIDTVSRVAQQALQSYDHELETQRVADSLQMAVANTALVEVGALGLGAAITAIASTSLADFTGFLAAGTLAVLGLLVIPAKKRKVKRELREKIATVREELIRTLTSQFEMELDRGLHEIEVAISPYTRFIRAERKHLDSARAELLNIREWLERQAADIQTML